MYDSKLIEIQEAYRKVCEEDEYKPLTEGVGATDVVVGNLKIHSLPSEFMDGFRIKTDSPEFQQFVKDGIGSGNVEVLNDAAAAQLQREIQQSAQQVLAKTSDAPLMDCSKISEELFDSGLAEALFAMGGIGAVKNVIAAGKLAPSAMKAVSAQGVKTGTEFAAAGALVEKGAEAYAKNVSGKTDVDSTQLADRVEAEAGKLLSSGASVAEIEGQESMWRKMLNGLSSGASSLFGKVDASQLLMTAAAGIGACVLAKMVYDALGRREKRLMAYS